MSVGNVFIDASEMDRAFDLALTWSQRTAKKLVGDTAWYVTRNCIKYTPAATMAEIDSKLNVQVIPVESKKRPGKFLSPKKSKNRNYIAAPKGSGSGDFKEVPLTWLIISARGKIGSDYNVSTDNRWMLGEGVHPLKGKKVGEFYAIMRDLISRMVKGRHSSIAYLKAGWAAVARKLNQIKWGSPEGSIPSTPGNYALGNVTYGSVPGTYFMKLSNLVGARGENFLDVKHNRALMLYGTPAAQRAVDEQAAELKARYMAREAAVLERDFNKI